jgi:hypothetical protein
MRFLLLFYLLANFNFLLAQSAAVDTAFIELSVQNAVRHYDTMMRGKDLYYNGSFYKDPPQNGEQHAFFKSEEWQKGAIVFDGHNFENLSLLFDLTKGLLVTETIHGNMFVINPQKLTAFTIGDHKFIQINNKMYKNSLPTSGYYQVLYEGRTMVLSLPEKSMQERIEAGKFNIEFDERERFYVLHKGVFHQVKGRSSILKILNEQKQSLKLLLRKNKVVFGKHPGAGYAVAAKLYDNLIDQ